MAAPTKTKPGTRKLSEVAKKLVVPQGIVSTGWPAVRSTCAQKLGVPFDDWQEGAGRVILAKRADGDLAAMVDGVGMSLPRQVGKTYLIGALTFALCVNTPGLLVIWSAHHSKTHGETFLAMQSFADRARVSPYVEQVFKGSGDEEIRFVNGSRILFGARERGFGRGIPGVDVLVFDEAQILSDRALANMLATMNTSKFGLALYIGTPPRPEDNAESFKRMRADAYAGRLTDGVWIEFGADEGASPDDRKQLAKANPSYPHRTPEKSIRRLQRKLTPEDFLREGYGIWDEESAQSVMPLWSAGAVDAFPLEPVGAVGVAVSVDREWGAIGAADKRDGVMHLGTVRREQGTHWIAEEARRIYKTYGCPVIIDGRGPGADLIDDLQDAGAWVVEANTQQYLDGCAELFDGVAGRRVVHMSGDAELNTAVTGAGKRPVGDRWAWSRTKSTNDVSVLEAVTLAAWGVNYIGGGVILG